MNTVVCRNCNTQSDKLYILPCRHVICEDCLVPINRSEVMCGYCGNHFKKCFVADYVPYQDNESSTSDDSYY